MSATFPAWSSQSTTSPAPLFLDNVRLERDQDAAKVFFEGLRAFDFQANNTCPLMEGFTAIVPSSVYNEGKGFGLKNAGNPTGQNALQPDPLYQDYLDITQGGLAVDVPNGKYRVWVNVNRPNRVLGRSAALEPANHQSQRQDRGQ